MCLGVQGQCISNAWLCDGDTDCPQGDDESHSRCSMCLFISNLEPIGFLKNDDNLH